MIALTRRTFLGTGTAALAALWLPTMPASARKRRCRIYRPLTPWAREAPWPKPTRDLLPYKRLHCVPRRQIDARTPLGVTSD